MATEPEPGPGQMPDEPANSSPEQAPGSADRADAPESAAGANAAAPAQSPEQPAEPQPVEVIDALYARLGEAGVKGLVQECLRATDRGRAVSLINEYVGTVRLSPGTDRGRIGRLLIEGLHRRRTPVLDVVQTLARDPFELQARPQAQDRLDEAVQALNDARGSGEPEDLAAASNQVVAALRQVIDAEQARRLLLVNAFPDTIEPLLAALEADSRASK